MRKRIACPAAAFDASREALLLFNEKAERLQRSALLRRLKRGPLTIKLVMVPGKQRKAVASPISDDSLDAFLLTLRFFLQDNESSSFRNMAKHYDSLPLPQELRDRFHAIRERLNGFLDAPSAIGIVRKGEAAALSRRNVLEAYLWGERAHRTHSNSVTHRALRDWLKQDPMYERLSRLQLAVLLGDLAQIIGFVRTLNLESLKHLDHAEKP
jgi:hypothetical protein